ncbi:MAG: PAS domain S-box protein [Polyangia bacterium]
MKETDERERVSPREDASAEEKLRESRRQLATLFDHLPGMAYRCRNDRSWTMKIVSRGCLDLTGYLPEEILDNARVSYGELIHSEDKERVWNEVQAAVAGREPFVLEYRIRGAGGREKWVWERGSAVRDDQDGSVLLEGFIIDITARKRLRRKLERSEERYRSLVENLDDVVFMLDLEARIQYISSAIEKYGYSVDEVVGLPFSRFVHPDDVERLLEGLRETLAGGIESRDFRAYDKQGRVRHVRTSVRPLEIGGRLEGLTGVLVDLTERKRIEDQLRASQKMEAVGQLAGGVAHDFNNLLTAIDSYAELAAGELRESDPIREDLIQIRDATRRAAGLTRQLLAFGRKQVMDPEVLDFGAVITGLESMLRRLLGEHIEITVRRGEPLGCVKADLSQLEQVIVNLALNARDAMPTGGELTLSTAEVELDGDRAGEADGVEPGRYVVLSVSDNGCGMDTETLERIFDPFFTTKEKSKGTGLGLSTVYGIVKQSGGQIRVESDPGRGTTFEVFLPRVDGPPRRRRRSSLPAQIAGGETVLVVEDEQMVRRIAERVLRASGYRVLSAANAGEALLICEQHDGEIDLVLTDMVMPQMSGEQLAERLAERWPKIRVLYMSGYTGDEIAQHGSLDPEIHFVSKPFTASELAGKVRAALDE